MPEEHNHMHASHAPLAPVADLIERTLGGFGRLFSSLFPWLVISCIGGLLAAWSQFVTSDWQAIVLGLVGVIVMVISYLAEARIIAQVQKDPKDIVSSGATGAALFFPYIWLLILQSIILLGGVTIFFIPGFIFMIFLVPLLFVFVADGQRGFAALTRSWSYVSGRWWGTLWRMLVFFFLLVVVTVVVNLILTLGFGSATGPAASWGTILFQQLVDAFLIVPIALSFLFQLYHDLKTTKHAHVAADEKTARFWLVIFLTIGIIVALLLIFGGVTHAGGHMFHYGGSNFGSMMNR